MPDFRVIPSIEQLRQRPAVQALGREYGHAATLEALREAAGELRRRLADGGPAPASTAEAAADIEQRARERLAATFRPSLRPVINATGVILHTNLGRAPLSRRAAEHAAALARGYSNLEYDLVEGTRGSRHAHAEALLRAITRAEAALVTNNCAAAMLLVLSALARGREVIISRGELVEIGGGFRVPEILAQSGAYLREVGTTNRTRLGDYGLAIGPRTGAIVRVHRSNFTIEGFTERPDAAELAALAHRHGLPLIEDLGSGWLHEAPPGGPLAGEPRVQASIRAGVDVVCFSGDKLLGGPQAGIIVGRAEILARVRRHPLMRAVRVDKLTYAALEATLVDYATGRAADEVPVLRMLLMPLEAIVGRAETLASRLREAGIAASLVDSQSAIGGGSAPGERLPTRAVALAPAEVGAAALERRLRLGEPPVVARIEDDRLLIDLRTVMPEEDETLAQALVAAVRGSDQT
ncbi:MAG TPA: L-seryl-tRNA(Sec) selenium transferase [Vicinamibacterales bacterium]